MAKNFIYKPPIVIQKSSEDGQNTTKLKTNIHGQSPTSSTLWANSFTFDTDFENTSENVDRDVHLYNFNARLEKEIEFYSHWILNENDLNKSQGSAYQSRSTKSFWLENQSKLPILFELAIILLNIPASSSSIERFFSITGAVCDQRKSKMMDDLIGIRCMLKANYETLINLNKNVK